MESMKTTFFMGKVHGLKNRQLGKLMENWDKPMDVCVRAFFLLYLFFSFLFNYLEKKKKGQH